MRPESNILFMMSGSIACAKATGLVSAWVKAGHSVKIACTSSVSEFVGRATLEGLSGHPVFGDTFEAGRAMDHIGLAQWADVVVVCPASANLLAKFANGVADDAVSTLWQACWDRSAPLFIVPAMNTHMWNYPATQANVERLRSWGIHVLPTASGELACGESGAGRMLEIDDIQSHVDRAIASASQSGLKILVTGGGTREPIDAVRYIGNHSTGRTASVLAETFAREGHDVTWLGGAGSVEPGPRVKQERFVSFEDLQGQLERLLSSSDFDAVVHAAAVSDFSVDPRSLDAASDRKLSSSGALELRLTPNPKLLDALRGWSRNPTLQVVGFKLTVGADVQAREAAVRKLFAGNASDWVVHNDYATMTQHRHPFTIYDNGGERLTCVGPVALAEALSAELTAHSTTGRADEPTGVVELPRGVLA